jgi:predicted RNA-binding Zn ribbon-like protein
MGYYVLVVASPSPAATAKLVGGDLCLDFVNTVGGRVPADDPTGPRVLADKLDGYSDLVAWCRHVGALDEANARRLARLGESQPGETMAVLARALAFREALHRTLRALMLARRPEPRDVSVLNAEIAAARGREVLVPARDGLRFEWPDAGRLLDSPLWPVARAAAALLTSGDLSRLRQCGGERCGWLFLDRSRNRSRQWCTMEDCGNVSKVRRFRQRQGRQRGGGKIQDLTPARERRSKRPSRST